MVTTKSKLTQAEKEDLIHAVLFVGVPVVVAAEIFDVHRTSVHRLIKAYEKTPEKFPGVATMEKERQIDSMWETNRTNHITLVSPPEPRISEYGHIIDLGGSEPFVESPKLMPILERRGPTIAGWIALAIIAVGAFVALF